jgi:hypothetical protein
MRPPLASMYSVMGLRRRSAGEPLSMRRTEASVLVAKNWKMVSMHRAEMLSQSRKPRAYAIGFHILGRVKGGVEVNGK